MSFVHLHNHTEFSLLDGASNIKKLFKKAALNNMPGLAITDHGNMFGVFDFVKEAGKHRWGVTEESEGTPMKAIVGCEFYIVEDRTKKQFTKEKKDERYHQVLLAKNEIGYKNLVKLCSKGFTEGMYSKYPRIDKSLILEHHEGLIATTCCVGGLVPKTILNKSEAEAEIEFKWWLAIFGEDYYIELQRHGIEIENIVNITLLKFAKKYNVKTIATNDSHYVDVEDANAHDILLCINTGEKQSTPKMNDYDVDSEIVARDKRFAFTKDEFYLKTKEQMAALYTDVPESIANTMEVFDKIEPLKLTKEIMLPHFIIPAGFDSMNEYLADIAYKGAKKRYGEITQEIDERLKFELFTITTMDFAGYFLIVADFINHGKEIGVFVGPGRGSAAGSVVAYCIGITNIDPIKYSLLFERFLNPDRKSMPDIDTDFDDEGRQKVIDYVVEKYGKNQVAQIVTFGTLGAKSSIKDVARVMDLPLSESIELAKWVSDRPGTKLKNMLHQSAEDDKMQGDDLINAQKLREIYAIENSPKGKILKVAERLEGTVKNTGVHAAGLIIAPTDISDILPVCTSKESELYLTQYEGNSIEAAGVIKMDFLGLKTLTILRDALLLIKKNHAVSIDLDTLALDDAKVFELYQNGATSATFQFESEGMQGHLKNLKPDKFEDLIAMNALYRPGPMDYIPSYIRRKQGLEQVTYDLPEMEQYLNETYGITVYQEQVMLLSQKLASFTKGQADTLRKAMGKKDKATLDVLRPKFFEGATALGHAEKILIKIWGDWEKFTEYAFNKSHSTCYAMLAYQTAYLKVHYPAEYMASVLSHAGDVKKISFFMEECKRMNVTVLGPDINESGLLFEVNQKGQIRFALSALKGAGEAACLDIIKERNTRGRFESIFDVTKRLNAKSTNKRVLESLINGGAFDEFGIERARYFAIDTADASFNQIERAIKYGAQFQNNTFTASNNLFGDAIALTIPEPLIPAGEEYPLVEKLRKEKEIIGMFVSGHPLDVFKLEIDSFVNCSISEIETKKNKIICIAGILSSSVEAMSKNGNLYGRYKIEDFDDVLEFVLFGESFLKFKHLLVTNSQVFMRGNYEANTKNEGQWDFKPSHILLLNEVRNRLTKLIVGTIEFNLINKNWVLDLNQILSKFPGKIKLNIVINSEFDEVSLKLNSSMFTINPTNEALSELQQVLGLELKLA